MILSNKRKTKALIRLRGCADWFARVLFANHRRQIFLQSCMYLQTELTRLLFHLFGFIMPTIQWQKDFFPERNLLFTLGSFIRSLWFR